MSQDNGRIHIPGKARHVYATREEAANLAADMGQKVYDQVRKEHAMAMELLQKDLSRHFRDIKETAAASIVDLQCRSISFGIAYDVERARRKLVEWYWTLRYRFGWVHDDGVIGGIEPDPPLDPKQLEGEPENVGAPTEQPSRSDNVNEASRVQGSASENREAVGGPDEERGRNPRGRLEESVAGGQAEESRSAQGEGKVEAAPSDDQQRVRGLE